MVHILSGVPASFEDELFAKYKEIERNYREHRWEPSELNGGKLCEVVYSILRGHVDGKFAPKPTKPPNFAVACANLEKAPAGFGRSLRLLIPRILLALYDIRNSRSVGHIGGDVDPNHMDALCVLHMAKWVVAETIRIFHGISVEEAQNIVETISDREIALVWDTGAIKRVLDVKLTMLEKTLVLLYSNAGPVDETRLLASLEHSNPSIYRRDILRKSHKARLLEYDEATRNVLISPLGSKRVELEILPKSAL